MNTAGLIQAVLFAVAEPMTIRRLSSLLDKSGDEVREAVRALASSLEQEDSGLRLLVKEESVELVTSPEASDVVRKTLKEEVEGELTKPSLEALTILAYRGPMTRPELEQIRGVQSSMILRNLMLRGLVEMKEDVRLGQPLYAVTLEFMKHLGLAKQSDLPKFEELGKHAAIEDVLSDLEAPEPKET